MIHLIVASLILGIYPCKALLRSAQLAGPFEKLVEYVRIGNGAAMEQELANWQKWHRKQGNYLLLKEKLPITVWRNLLRRR